MTIASGDTPRYGIDKRPAVADRRHNIEVSPQQPFEKRSRPGLIVGEHDAWCLLSQHWSSRYRECYAVGGSSGSGVSPEKVTEGLVRKTTDG